MPINVDIRPMIANIPSNLLLRATFAMVDPTVNPCLVDLPETFAEEVAADIE